MRLLVTGAGGQLGTDVVRLAQRDGGHEVTAARHTDLDVGDRDAVMSAVTALHPDVIIHAAAWTAVDACESDTDRAWRDNALACRYVAQAARMVGSHVVAVSTDYVFDGELERPYTEWDRPNPTSSYGRSKLGGEDEIRAGLPGAAVVRTSWVCGANGSNMVKTILRLAAGDGTLRFVDDQTGCPTFTEDLAGVLLRVAAGRLGGLFHVTNQGPTSWFGFAQSVLAAAGLDPARVEPISTQDLDPPRPAKRPANSVLDNVALRLGGFRLLPDYHEPLERTVKTLLAS